MTPVERQIVLKLYNEACHGAGAQVRTSARHSLEAMICEAGESMKDVFDRYNLCMASYFASRPIS